MGSPFAATMLLELGRTTLWLALAGTSAALVLKWARVQSPRLHRICWCATLLVGCFLLRVPVEVPWYAPEPVVTAELPPESASVEQPAADFELLALPPTEAEPMLPDFEAPLAAAPLAMPPALPPVVESASTETTRQLPSLAELAIGVYLAGAVGLAATWLFGYCRFVWRLPGGIEAPAEWQAQWNALSAGQGGRRPIPLRVTHSLGPLLCRLPRGYELLVPGPLWRRLSVAEREAILRHELAHYRRGDVWKSLAARLLAVVHWFNPVSWWAVRRFDEAAEWACDQAAIADEPTVYAKILMHLGELSRPQARYGSALRGRRLAARIRRLVSPEQKEDSAMKKALLISVAACVVAAALVRVQLVAQEPAEPRDADPAGPVDQEEGVFGGDLGRLEPEVAGPVVEPGPPATRVEAARKMVKTAERAYDAAFAAFEAETTVLESVHVWSSRWLAAELAVARNQQRRLAAATANLQGMRRAQGFIATLNKAGVRGGEAFQMASADFFVAEAERKLAEIQSPPPALPADAPSPPPAVRPVPIPNAVPGPAVPKAAPRSVASPVPKQEPAPPYQVPRATPRPTLPPDRPAPALSPQPYTPDDPAAAAPQSRAVPPGPVRNKPRDQLRYDGKTFDEWATVLRTDLSPAARLDAISAMGEFAVNGLGSEAAIAILDAMRGYSVWIMDDSPVGKMKEAAIVAVQKVPLSDVLPIVNNALRTGNNNQRLLAVYALPVDRANDEVALQLVSAMGDKDSQVAQMARYRLAAADHDNPALADWLRKSLTGEDQQQVNEALGLLIPPTMHIRGPTQVKTKPNLSLLGEVIALLDHDDVATRRRAADTLRLIGKPALPALEREASKSATDVTSKRAGQLLEQIPTLKPDMHRGSFASSLRFHWERQ